MFPSPHDLLPIFHCPLCPPASLLSAPTTLRCGHSLCAHHVRSSTCPIPGCSTQQQSFTPSSSRVAFHPAPLSTPPHTVDDFHRAPDVRVNNIIRLLHAADAPQDLSLRFPDPFDDDSDPDDPSDPDLPSRHTNRHRHRSDSTSLLKDFEKALSTELTCEICFMLLYQPVTTPCQHVRLPPPSSTRLSPPHRLFVQSVSSVLSTTACFVLSVVRIFPASLTFKNIPTTRSFFPSVSLFPHLIPCQFTFSPLVLRAFPDVYSSRCDAMEREGRDARLDTPIFVCQLSFPGMPTLLHFFEPRYRLMLRRCLEKPSPTFGMIMPPRAAPIPGHGTPAGSEFGTMLEIRSVQMLSDGRSMVETWGTHRFRILEQGSLDGYMIGKVESIDDYDDDLAEWADEDDDSAPSSSHSSHVNTRPPSPQSLLTRIAHRISPPPSPVSATCSQDSTSSSTSQHFLSTPALLATCHAFSSQLRAGMAPWVVQRLNYTYGPQPPDTDPGAFSFWMGMVLPIDEHEKAKLLPVKSARLRLRMVVGWIEQLNSNWSVFFASSHRECQ
ncbi:PUA-like domain-containing protein [Lanmaoa asiatica]|nr:PUA-like domain-containing protein [Lanmaoa asiatica]